MAKPRKGPKPFEPLLPILLRDAMPTWFEIEGEKDTRKRKANELKRDKATAELMRLYRRANAAGKLRQLDVQVRHFCEKVIKCDKARAEAAGKARTGAPDQSDCRMKIAVAVALEIEARDGQHGCVEAALKAVAVRFKREYAAVRKIHYETDPDWRRALKASIAMRKLEALAKADPQVADQLPGDSTDV
jgi:hypothetical protein